MAKITIQMKFVEGESKYELPEDAVDNVEEELKNHVEDYGYSRKQIRKALWNYAKSYIEEILDNLDTEFLGLEIDEQNKWLGTPEVDLKLERWYEAGDVKFDARRDG